MRMPMMKHASPAGSRAAVSIGSCGCGCDGVLAGSCGGGGVSGLRLSGVGSGAPGMGMGGIVDDIQGKVVGWLAAPDAMKYVMYGVGALFLVMAMRGGRR